jgi:galactokinase
VETKKYEISNYGPTSEGAVATLKQIVARITGGDHIGVVIAFSHDGYLEQLLKIIKGQYDQKRT